MNLYANTKSNEVYYHENIKFAGLAKQLIKDLLGRPYGASQSLRVA